MTKETKKLIIASRKSPLAMVQSEMIKADLEQLYPEFTIEILAMSTEGDRKLSMPLATVGGKGLFVKELEQALLEHRADIAVHSTKDMPVLQPKDLEIATYYKRHDPRDAFVSNQYETYAALPEAAVVGTASLRRQCLLKHLRPDLTIKVLRGNVQTRLKKLDEGEYDAIVLAAAGLERQNLSDRAKSYFDPNSFTPAATQGIMCIECRSDDINTKAMLQPLHHEITAYSAIAERSMNLHLQGGCQVPIGAYASLNQDELHLQGLVGKPDGTLLLRAEANSHKNDAKALGIQVAENLLAQGAEKILREVYQDHG